MRRSTTGRALFRSLGAVLALAALLWTGAAALSNPPATAASTAVWSATGAPLPANADPGNQAAVYATSCPAPGNCVAVGAYASGGGAPAMVDTQSGGSWTAAEAPIPAGALAGPLEDPIAINCPTVGSCTAVGIYKDAANHNQGLLLTLAGGAWTAAEAPLPAGAGANPNVILFSVSCTGPAACIAAGQYADSGGNTQGVILTQNGTTWSATEAPLPAGAAAVQGVELVAVACGAAGSCAAVGHYKDGAANVQGLFLTLVGGTWSAVEAPLPVGAAGNPQATLLAVACPVAANCTAVGTYDDAAGSVRGVIESLANGAVSAIGAPVPPDAKASGTSPNPGSSLIGLSCPSAQFCLATGVYVTNASTGSGGAPLVDTLSGGTWTASTVPGSFVPAAETVLFGVSCSWPGSCAAVGISSNGGARPGFTETLADGTWNEAAAPLPIDASVPNSVLFGLGELAAGSVACVAGSCAAVGTYANAAGDGGFIDTYPDLTGYQMVASDGGLFAFNTPFFGSMGGQHLNQPVVGMAVVPDSGGYYEVATDGGIFAFGAPFFGSMGGHPLNQPIVGIAFDSRTGGYYEVASDGGIFAFNAPFLGSMGGQHLNEPIVGIAFDPATGGYYEVASDGGIFAFGAPFLGSTGSLTLNNPVVGMTVDTATGGYYEVASDGGLFAFGAPFLGSMGGTHLNQPVVGMAFDYLTNGYYEVASDGGIFAFGAPFAGSMGGTHLNQPVVGIAFG